MKLLRLQVWSLRRNFLVQTKMIQIGLSGTARGLSAPKDQFSLAGQSPSLSNVKRAPEGQFTSGCSFLSSFEF